VLVSAKECAHAQEIDIDHEVMMENAMNTTLISFVIAAAALAASTSALGNQPLGRDSVYARPGTSAGAQHGSSEMTTRSGRGSVYAQDLPAPMQKDAVRVTVSLRPGRA